MPNETYKPKPGPLRFFKLVQQMRKYQKEYLKTRSREALEMSRKLELLVDHEIEVGEAHLQRINEPKLF